VSVALAVIEQMRPPPSDVHQAPASTTPGTRPPRCSFEQGVHIRVVQEVLGHTRVTTTERYTQVATLQMKGASDRMDQALSA
jgi:hypothetical protein